MDLNHPETFPKWDKVSFILLWNYFVGKIFEQGPACTQELARIAMQGDASIFAAKESDSKWILGLFLLSKGICNKAERVCPCDFDPEEVLAPAINRLLKRIIVESARAYLQDPVQFDTQTLFYLRIFMDIDSDSKHQELLFYLINLGNFSVVKSLCNMSIIKKGGFSLDRPMRDGRTPRQLARLLLEDVQQGVLPKDWIAIAEQYADEKVQYGLKQPAFNRAINRTITAFDAALKKIIALPCYDSASQVQKSAEQVTSSAAHVIAASLPEELPLANLSLEAPLPSSASASSSAAITPAPVSLLPQISPASAASVASSVEVGLPQQPIALPPHQHLFEIAANLAVLYPFPKEWQARGEMDLGAKTYLPAYLLVDFEKTSQYFAFSPEVKMELESRQLFKRAIFFTIQEGHGNRQGLVRLDAQEQASLGHLASYLGPYKIIFLGKNGNVRIYCRVYKTAGGDILYYFDHFDNKAHQHAARKH